MYKINKAAIKLWKYGKDYKNDKKGLSISKYQAFIYQNHNSPSNTSFLYHFLLQHNWQKKQMQKFIDREMKSNLCSFNHVFK